MIINENNLGNYTIPEDVNGVCIDIGANVGNFIKNNYNRFEKIYAYEPIKILYEKIKSFNIPNAIIYNEAVLDVIGETEVILHNNKESGSTCMKKTIDEVVEISDWSNTVINKVNTVNLEEVINRTGSDEINFMKIDCENSEYLILLNKDLTKIKYIAIEIHNQMRKDNWDRLKSWVEITHTGFPEYDGNHHEVLLTRK